MFKKEKVNWRRGIVAGVLLTMVVGLGSPVSANYYEDKQKKLENRLTDIKKTVVKYKKKSGNLEDDKREISEELDRVRKMVKKAEERFDQKKAESDQVRADLLATYEKIRVAESELAAREGEFRGRIQSMRRGDNETFLSVVVSSDSFSDMVNRVFSYKKIVDEDNEAIESYFKLVDDLEEAKKEREELMKTVEASLVRLGDARNDLVLEREKVVMLRKEKELASMDVADRIDVLMEEKEKIEVLLTKLAKEKKRFEKVMSMARVDVTNFEKDASVEKEMEAGRLFITPTNGRFTSPYGNRPNPTGPGIEFHTGIDIANRIGTPVYGVADGEVVKVERGGYGYGNVLFIRHKVGKDYYMSVYAHLDSFAVEMGDKIEQGQIVALMGSTGRSTGPHLHFEVRTLSGASDMRGQHRDPLIYVGKDTEMIRKVSVADEKKKKTAKAMKTELKEIDNLQDLKKFQARLDKETKKKK